MVFLRGLASVERNSTRQTESLRQVAIEISCGIVIPALTGRGYEMFLLAFGGGLGPGSSGPFSVMSKNES
jgi:hypothetical protein